MHTTQPDLFHQPQERPGSGRGGTAASDMTSGMSGDVASNMASDTASDTASMGDVPTSFGVFKPVGWMMVGLPKREQAEALVAALHAAGWPSARLLHFDSGESAAELEAMVDNAGSMSGFGYEITMLRRYAALAKEGCRWLLVKVDGTDQASQAADAARACGAILAVHYRTLTIEELI